MKIYLGDELYETYALKWDGVPQNIEVPVNYAANVRITVDTSWYTKYAMYDIEFTQ